MSALLGTKIEGDIQASAYVERWTLLGEPPLRGIILELFPRVDNRAAVLFGGDNPLTPLTGFHFLQSSSTIKALGLLFVGHP